MDALIRRWTLQDRATPAVSALDASERGSGADDAEHQPEYCHRSNQDEHAADVDGDRAPTKHDLAAASGTEWVWVEEPVGFFFPTMQKRKCLVELDQVRHVLHYDHYRRVIHIHDISLVTSVEEVAGDGRRAWWMTIQDPRTPQVWVLHFTSLDRLVRWVALLRAVVQATAAPAIISDVVLASTLDRRPSLAKAPAPGAVPCCKQLDDAACHRGPETLEQLERAVMIAVP